jgi:sec-independent protein translocase protein TatC
LALFGKNKTPGEMSFLDHLEDLRWHLVRGAISVVVAAIFLFLQKDFIFDGIIFAPANPNFITYRALCSLSHAMGMGEALCMSNPDFKLVSTTLAGQFTMHIWVSIVGGIIVSFPYIVFQIWSFIKPALKQTELHFSRSLIFFVSLLFLAGILFGYYVITPLSVNFLSGYQVSTTVSNMIEVESFISTVTTITFASGLVFQLPVLIYFLSLLGLVGPAFLRTYRKHSIVVILLVAAVITPSPDITSQLLVAAPLYILYEISIFVSAYVQNKNASK